MEVKALKDKNRYKNVGNDECNGEKRHRIGHKKFYFNIKSKNKIILEHSTAYLRSGMLWKRFNVILNSFFSGPFALEIESDPNLYSSYLFIFVLTTTDYPATETLSSSQ